jgi:glycosyltransferase involved in cell wall biosynthesis
MALRVSALVSAYNADKFIRGRLDDLMAQTLYARNELEIIVINSASTDTTQAILEREYLDHITLIQTPFRESMYAAWNRGIALAKGDYIVPANCDDRLCFDAYETMADHLDYHYGVDMVCPDSYVTSTENAVWISDYDISHFELCKEPPYTTGRLDFVNSPHPQTMQCKIGNTPMWRKSLHDEIGLFDLSYLIAGDYEWALRLEAHGKCIDWIDDVLGLFYFHPSTQGRAYAEQSAYESRRAVLKWRSVIERLNQDVLV